VPTAPAMAPSVFHAKTRALAGPASEPLRASTRTPKGSVAPMQSAAGSSVAAATAAFATWCVPPPAAITWDSAGKRSAARNAVSESAAVPNWAHANPRAAFSGLLAKRDATAEPAAIPVRKLPSMVAKA